MSMEPKPCPICGGDVSYQPFNVKPSCAGRIICGCGLEIRHGWDETRDELVARWNDRPNGTKLYFNVPDGFHVVEGATTAPNGYRWIAKGSLFDGSREHGLISVYNIENPSRHEPMRLETSESRSTAR